MKGHHIENMEIDQNLEMQKKVEEINGLKTRIKELEEQLRTREANNKSREAVEVVTDTIEVIEEDVINLVTKPPTKTAPKIGKARPTPQIPSPKNVSICAHRDELVIEDIPDFEFKCNKCGKGFRHKENLNEHMICHSKTCGCVYPCVPIRPHEPAVGPTEAPRFTDVPPSCRKAFSLQPDVEQSTCLTLWSRKTLTNGPIRGARSGSLEGWYEPPPSNDLQLC